MYRTLSYSLYHLVFFQQPWEVGIIFLIIHMKKERTAKDHDSFEINN